MYDDNGRRTCSDDGRVPEALQEDYYFGTLFRGRMAKVANRRLRLRAGQGSGSYTCSVSTLGQA